jgi:hypothetical protein
MFLFKKLNFRGAKVEHCIGIANVFGEIFTAYCYATSPNTFLHFLKHYIKMNFNKLPIFQKQPSTKTYLWHIF